MITATELFGEVPLTRYSQAGFNPSVALHGDALYSTLRTANYRIVDHRYVYEEADQTIRTRNYFCRLGEDGTVAQAAPMLGGEAGAFPGPVRGFEDCRLFRWRGQWWCSATVRDRNPDDLCQIALLRLDQDFSIAEVRVLPGPNPGRHEKNWVPVVQEDDLFFIYSTVPTLVLKYLPEGNVLDEFCRHPFQLEELRGSSQAIAFEDGWLYLARHLLPERPRIYLHRFVSMDPDFRVRSLSLPFCFSLLGIEFCAGLTRRGDRLLASFGSRDEEAWLATFPFEAVRDIMKKGGP